MGSVTRRGTLTGKCRGHPSGGGLPTGQGWPAGEGGGPQPAAQRRVGELEGVTYGRKVREAVIALKLNQQYTKG
ncbi:hypothetical protein AB0M46_08285, partial [Dactylosporangium sp. NPDC051485]|uniref:hypothetical protein n=1 Tax=Dactylosporangium sp. NPDC051485 TaxID=3154846 RepID=UPI00341EDF9E